MPINKTALISFKKGLAVSCLAHHDAAIVFYKSAVEDDP